MASVSVSCGFADAKVSLKSSFKERTQQSLTVIVSCYELGERGYLGVISLCNCSQRKCDPPYPAVQ
jgi:hypothetical protein